MCVPTVVRRIFQLVHCGYRLIVTPQASFSPSRVLLLSNIQKLSCTRDPFYFTSFQDFETALKHYAKNVQSCPDVSTFQKSTAARDEIKEEVESIQSGYQALQLHADETRGRLSRAMEQSDVSHPEIEDETTRWNSSVQRLLDWVESQEESLANQSAPSLDKTELKEQLEKHRVSG